MRRKKKRRFLKFILFLILLLGAMAALGYSYLGGMTVSEGAEGFPTPGDKVNIVVVGVAKGLSDTIMFCSYDKVGDSVEILSVPRDTYYPRKGYNRTAQKKINAAYGSGGVLETVKSIEGLLGVPVHYYFEINYQAVEEIVNAIGGIEITVPRNMKYDDPADDLHIDFKEGQVISAGEDIVKILRWRKNNKGGGGYAQGDIGRIEMQHEVVKKGIETMTDGNLLFNFFKVKDTITDNIKTNMTPKQMLYYMFSARDIDSENIKMQTIPGVPKTINGLSFYVPNKSKISDMIEVYK